MWISSKILLLLKEIRKTEDLSTIDAITREIEKLVGRVGRPYMVMEDE